MARMTADHVDRPRGSHDPTVRAATCGASGSTRRPITGQETVADLIDNAFLAYNAGRLREGCQLFTQRMLEPDCTVGMTLTGAMTPAGLGMSCLIPLMEAGFVDWIISTGANLYHDAHFALGLRDAPGHARSPTTSSCARRAWCGSTTSSSTTACCSPPTRSSAR